MAAEEELRARAVLAEMQMRITQGPHAALSVAETANAEQVRAAFLQLTKQFHPARFGRMSGEIHKLANEVFLGIKSAHDALTKQLGSTGRPQPAHTTGIVTTEIQRPAPMPGGTQRGTGLVPRTLTPQFARGTDRANHRPSTPNMTAAAPQRPATSPPRSVTTPATGVRAATPSPATTSQQITQVNTRVGTPPVGVPVRAATPSGDQMHRATSPAPRPSSPHGVVRPGTPPLRPGTPPPPDALNPPTIRYSGVQPVQPTQRLPRVGAFDEQAALRAAMDLLSSKDYAGARQAFHALAAKMPQSRHYRALLCYARGRETAASGRIDDAVMEFQRALQLDSELEIAKQAIRELGRKSRF